MSSPGASSKGQMVQKPSRQMAWVLTTLVIWLVMVCMLGAWWVSLVLRQAFRISELESLVASQLPADQIARMGNPIERWEKTRNMIHWESATFFAFLLGSTALMIWIYFRDLNRSHSLRAFFASMTHELRTPLTSIRLQAESVLDNLGQKTASAPLLQRLMEDTSRLEAQVDRTLELARVEGGGAVFLEPVALKSVLERLIEGWRENLGDRVKFRLALNNEVVWADTTALQVILKNLFENSLRHSGIPAQDVLVIDLGCVQKDHQIRLTFGDNGKGFDGDYKRLAQLFHKGAKSQGAGVGLYLVRALMERMNGQLLLNSTPEKPGFNTVLLFKTAIENG